MNDNFNTRMILTTAVVAATVSRRPSWLAWQAAAGVLAIVLTWRIGEWSGAYADQDAEGCSDCGELWGFALWAMVASCTAWVVGTAFGGAIGILVRRWRQPDSRPPTAE